MALVLRKDATHAIPVGPKCFSSSSGILLSPELLLALNLWASVSVSSAGEMCYVGASASGENTSLGSDASKNISLLKSLNVSNDMSVCCPARVFSMAQNFFGYYFIMSGRVNYIFALLSLQHYM